MFLKLAYLPPKLHFSGKYLFYEHQISMGQPSANSSLTETLYCLSSYNISDMGNVQTGPSKLLLFFLLIGFAFIAELQCEAPSVRKIGNPSRQENLVTMSPSSIRDLVEGEGHLNDTCNFRCSQSICFIHLLRSLSHQN